MDEKRLDDIDNSLNSVNENDVCLISKQGDKFIISRKAAELSGRWKELQEPIPTIRLEAIDTQTLTKIVDYCNYKIHQNGTNEISELNLDLSTDNVIPTLLAAHFLDL